MTLSVEASLTHHDRHTEQERRNSFDIIRLFAAFCVFYSHQLAFAGIPEPSLGPLGISLASTGLYIFFALSGYLVFKSIAREDRANHYFRARILRIFPGSFVNVLFCLALGSLITTVSWSDFWNSRETLSYFLHNASIIVTPTQFALPGVLADARWPVVNGSIWTIKYELLCYLALFAFFRVARFTNVKPRSFFFGAFVCFLTFYVYRMSSYPKPEDISFFSDYNAFNTARFSMTFFFGAFLAALEPLSERSRLLAFALPAVLIVFGPSPVFARAGIILLLTLLVIEIGRTPIFFSATYRQLGDLSYGFFLYAYPIQAWVLTKYFDGNNIVSLTAVCTLLVLGCAWLSWQFVERIALRYKVQAPKMDRKARAVR
jgi:peptidoglycan/LPS O-acetylase OafA/YrhL